jgi:hypothetical protein
VISPPWIVAGLTSGTCGVNVSSAEVELLHANGLPVTVGVKP